MALTFKIAPLVEIIAELRWAQQSVPVQPGAMAAPPGSMLNAARLDEFFMRFGGECYKAGFQRAGRIVPPGFPVFRISITGFLRPWLTSPQLRRSMRSW